MEKAMARNDGRKANQLRKIKMTPHFSRYPAGSVLIEMGNTHVLCNATIEESIPPFMQKGGGKGWVTAEYAMLPASSPERIRRESSKGKIGGRTHEIQRLIGRSLRSVTNLNALGERSILIDCDVLQADGGTRTASITGGFVALIMALKKLKGQGLISKIPVKEFVAAVSVGIYKGKVILDLDYSEDSNAEVDMNIVMTDKGRFIEVQGTAEEDPFSEAEMHRMLSSAKKGVKQIVQLQKKVLKWNP